MDNLEYIKSLEERIKKLEDFISAIKIEGKNNISFTNCEIQGIGLQSCKNISITGVNTQNFGFAAFSAKIENSNIHNFENKSQKTKIYNSKISNDQE